MFLVQKSLKIYPFPFPEKFELDDYGEIAFPTLFDILKGLVSKKMLELCPRPLSSLFPQSFRLFFICIVPFHA